MNAEKLDDEFSMSLSGIVDDSEFTLVSPKRMLVASDVVGRLDVRGGESLGSVATRANELLADAERRVGARERTSGAPLLVGAVPFHANNEESAARLVAVRDVRQGPAPVLPTERGALRSDVRHAKLVPCPDGYMDGVRRALDQMSATTLRKVVLARAIDLGVAEPIRKSDVVRSLIAVDPAAYVFAARLDPHDSDHGRDRGLVGATPELVVRRTGNAVLSNPLAGSAPRSADPDEDRARAQDLACSDKDLREHRIVVDAVADALRPHCVELTFNPRPSVIRTATMWHLSTEVHGVLATPAPNALELASAVHPTPAVCGWPTVDARQVIVDSEGFDRRYYGGLTGWMNADGDGEWTLALRCAEIAQDQLRLYAGAGVVPGSDAAAELVETSAKFQTFMAALGLDYATVEDAARAAGEPASAGATTGSR